jgi:hypothetical protein
MKYLPLIFGIAFLFACKKPEDRSCLKKSGGMAERTVTVQNFDRLFLKEHIEYVLIQDSTDKVVIRGGENLLNFITIESTDGLLTLSNHNKCNYLRHYATVKVEIHYTKLINILYEGTETLTTEDTLKTDYLTLTLKDGGGSMDVCIDALDVNAVNTNGWGDLKLSGKAVTTKMQISGDGCFDCQHLETQGMLNVISSSSRPQKVKASGIPLKAEINGIGNIEYVGFPSTIFLSRYGKGELINRN